MFDIYAVPPMQTKEVRVTTRKTRADADFVVKNLTGFGYKGVRVVDRDAPRPHPPTPPTPPAPKPPTPPPPPPPPPPK